MSLSPRFRKEYSPSDVAAMIARLSSGRGLDVTQHTAARHPEPRVLHLDESRAHLMWVGATGRRKYLRLRDVMKIEAAGDFDGKIVSSSWAIWLRGSSGRASCYLSIRLRRACAEQQQRCRVELGKPVAPDHLAGAKRIQSSFDLEFSSAVQREVFIDALENLCENAKA